MLLLTFVSVALIAVFLTLILYMGFDGQVKSELQSKAVFLEKTLNQESQDVEYLKRLNLPVGDVRITIVTPTGAVLYDNVSDPDTMENHADREEITEALIGGTGESSRVSTTLGEKTYYYSKRLSNGNVLRTAKTTSSIYGVFMQHLPACILIILLILLLAHFLAKSLTKKITKPINDIDLDTTGCVYDELSPMISTITRQRRQINTQFTELERRTNTITSIIENMQEGILLLDRSGNVLSLNHSAMSLLQTTADAFGKNIIEIIRDPGVTENAKAALCGVRSSSTIRITTKTYTVFFSPVSGNGAMVLFVDVTDRVNAEKMRREFSANVSHELKTPLTSISGYAEMINAGLVQKADITLFSGKIKDESARLLNLIEDIIRLSELDETERVKTFTPVNLADIVTEVMSGLHQKAEDCNVIVKPDLQTTTINADRQMIFEMLYNLIDNAIKYNQPDGSVQVTLKPSIDSAEITVSDNGIGIPPAHIDRVFERFYRVDKSHSKNTGGTGLGLSIVKHIVLCHGGDIQIQSISDVGTIITVTLPNT